MEETNQTPPVTVNPQPENSPQNENKGKKKKTLIIAAGVLVVVAVAAIALTPVFGLQGRIFKFGEGNEVSKIENIKNIKNGGEEKPVEKQPSEKEVTKIDREGLIDRLKGNIGKVEPENKPVEQDDLEAILENILVALEDSDAKLDRMEERFNAFTSSFNFDPFTDGMEWEDFSKEWSKFFSEWNAL